MALSLKNVLISDAVDGCCVDLLRESGFNVTCKYKLSKEQLINEIANYDGLIVRSDTKVTTDVLATCSSLKVIGRAGTGVDNIDIDAATRKGIIVLNTPGGNSISACELTCSLITCLARNVTQGCQSLKEGRWDRKLYTGSELSGKTLAILGLGRIGREVAVRMQAFGMRTVGFDPMVSANSALEFNVEKMELNQIWPIADYITVHTPLIPQTRNLINDITLSSCKRGVKIVNVARGGIVDEEALLIALKDGRCDGAALDVFLEEPPKGAVIRELIEHPHVIVTPHLGASTAEAQTRVAVEIAQQFIALAQPHSGYEVNGVVNAAVLSALRNPENTPWIELAKSLGKLASKLLRSEPLPSMSITINTEGNGLEQMKFLSTAVLVGMLSLRTSNGLNLINAPILAKDAGLKVSQGHTQGQTKSLTITVSSCSIKHSLQGRVQGDGTAQLTAVDDAQFTTGVALSSAVSLFQGNDAAQNIPAVIAELTRNGVTITNIAIANGKNVWIAVQTASEVPHATDFIPGVERY